MSSDLEAGTGAHDAPDPAEAVAAAVTAVPGVTGLHGGALGEVATYLPGRRVAGVRIGEDGTEVHVAVAWGTPVLQTADAVRDAALSVVGGPVHVTVEDVQAPA